MSDAPTAAPWEPPDGPGRFTVVESATRVGHYKWYAMGAFEFVGTWIAVLGTNDIKATLGVHCAEWAAAAETWHRRLGTIRDRTPQDWTRPPSDAHETWLANVGHVEFDASTEPVDALESLVGLYRVFVPRFVAELRAHRNGSARHADHPTLRAIQSVLSDLEDQMVVGEMMIESLMVGADDVARASRRQQDLETELVIAGGFVGPDLAGGWGDSR